MVSLCISIYNLVLLGFSPLFGVIADKKGLGLGVVVIGGATILGTIAAITLHGMGGAIVTAALISACGVCGSIAPVSLIKIFGPGQAGSLIGYAMVFGAIAQMTSGPIAARVSRKSTAQPNKLRNSRRAGQQAHRNNAPE